MVSVSTKQPEFRTGKILQRSSYKSDQQAQLAFK
ncbi:uncharacterized protein G2W53_011957 [Senna tora]|uniref:Uncharacterized protein n=1 Tax=Senna tora TaxID=362788 RepID=A0A834WSH0_9FABA|nr:uncharacterized protein G2W53_011957 [Senna tora]